MSTVKRHAVRLTAVAASAIALSGATVGAAHATPAPFWGPSGYQINTSSRPYVQYNAAGYGNDCEMAVGFHNNQATYGGNGDAQGDATFVCDGSRAHTFTAYTTLFAWLGGQWVKQSQNSTTFTNAIYGMGYSRALLTAPICNGGNLPSDGTYWLVQFDLYIDGVHRTLTNMPTGAAYYKYLPNHC
jgi:hypothetical protein